MQHNLSNHCLGKAFRPTRADELLDQASEGAWRERDSRLASLDAGAHEVEQALYRQALRLEEQDDRGHPVVRLATQRIEELSVRERAIAAEIAALEAAEPDDPRREEIEAILGGLPDLRDVLEEAEPEELIDVFDAFDLAVTYDKPAQTLELSVLISTDLADAPGDAYKRRPPTERSHHSFIAGAGFEPATFGL